MPRDVGKMEGETARVRERERDSSSGNCIVDLWLTYYKYKDICIHIHSPLLIGRTLSMANGRHSQHHSVSQNVIYKSGWTSSAKKYVAILHYYTCFWRKH